MTSDEQFCNTLDGNCNRPNISLALRKSLEDAGIDEIVKSLLLIIDQIDTNFRQARDYIFEIAKKMDESNSCPRDQICRKIKEILATKIKDGKITSKWIEECLPKEYKREYRKSELSSHLKSCEPTSIKNSGLLLCQENKYSEISPSDVPPENNNKTFIGSDNQLNFVKGSELYGRTCKFKIYKERKSQFDDAFDSCENFCTIIFNKITGDVVTIISDVSGEVD